MANRFQIDITARDKTAEGLKSVETNFTKLTRGTPIQGLSSRFKEILDRGQAFGKIGKAIGGLGDAGRGAAAGVEESAAAAGELGATLGVAATGLGVVTGGLALAGAAAFKFERPFSRVGAAFGFQADAIGQNVEALQRYQIAGEKAGVSAEAMAGAMQGLTQTLEDAGAGRNQTALMLMSRLGIQIHRLPNGAIDAARAMDDLGRAMAAQNPQARQLIAQTFGASAALNFLIETQAQREAQLREADRSGAIRSAKQIADNMRFDADVKRMGDAWHGLLNTMSAKLIVPWLEPVIEGLSHLIGQVDDIAPGSGNAAAVAEANRPFDRSGGSRAAARGLGELPAAKAERAAALRDRLAHDLNLSAAQAAGVVSNLMAESGLDAVNEKHPRVPGSRGGFGWGQWTGTRRKEFEAFAAQRELPVTSDEANYEFLTRELQSRYARVLSNVRRARTATEAAHAFFPYESGGAAVLAPDEAGHAKYADAIASAPPSGGARQAAPPGVAGANGAVHVTVDVRGAPAGSTVVAEARGQGVTTAATVRPSLPGGSI